MKIEIEHLQHLLGTSRLVYRIEQARLRLTRDFEHWYVSVYLSTVEPEQAALLEKNESDMSLVGIMLIFRML